MGTLNVPDPSSPEFSESRAYIPITVASICIVTCLVCASLRLYVRWFLIRKVGADDWALLWSATIVILICICFLANVPNGEAHHIWYLSKEQIVNLLKVSVASIILYQIALASIKATFLLHYRRVFPLPNIQRLCDVFLVLIILWGLSQTLVAGLFCVPLSSWWDESIEGKCINVLAWWYANSAVNLVTDLVIFILPLTLLHTLPLKLSQKIILMAVFGIGFFTCAISVIRISTLQSSATTEDVTWDVTTGVWSMVEPTCAIVCVCVPALRPLTTCGARRTRPDRRTSGYQQQPPDADVDLEALSAEGSGVSDMKSADRSTEGQGKRDVAPE